MKRFLALLLVFGFIFGCAQRKVVTQPEAQQPAALPQETQKKEVSETAKGPEKITEPKVAKIESKDIPAKYTEEQDVFKDIHFDFDKYDIRDDAKPVLHSISSWLIKNNSAKFLIEGHCDERGTNEYNLALGDRRAKATKDFLVSLGVSSNRIEIISYGEEKPLCTEQNEDCWAKNRRAHFVVLKEAGR